MPRFSTTSLLAITIAGLVTTSFCAREAPSDGLAMGTTHSVNATRNLNNRPLIGVLSQPGDPAPENHSYIAASYIKFVESAGARAVPIPYDAPAEEVRRLFGAINGAVIPGGGQNLSPHHRFYDTSALLLNLTMAANDRGDFFPLHGTCLGFEALTLIASGNMSILSAFDADDNASPLLLTDDGLRTSSFFGSFPARLLGAVQERALAMENHGWGLGLDTFYENEGLWSFFTVTSLSLDRQGVKYISTLEAKQYPVTATQWHPEKNAFEFPQKLHIPHSSEAVELTHAVAKFIVDQSRRSSHAPRSVEEEQEMLIYNYVPVYTGKGSKIHPGTESDFDQAYFFAPYQPKASSAR